MEKTFTKAIDVLLLAKQKGIVITLNEGKLQLRVPESKLVDEILLEEIRGNKQIIIDFLRDNQNATTFLTGNHKIKAFNREVRPLRVPLSFSQERLWFIDRLEGSVQYHIPAVLRLSGSLDVSALFNSLRTIVERHEILRTVYDQQNDDVYQRVKEGEQWVLQELDGVRFAEDEAGLQGYIQNLTGVPFDLSKDYAFRAELIKLSAQEHILVVTIHHIASDASSMPVLVQEVTTLYRGYLSGHPVFLPSLDLQYSDYATWQRETMQGELLSSKLEYWKGQLSGVSPLQLPADYVRGLNSQVQGATLMFSIETALADRVKALAQQEGVTLYMLLLSVFKVLLQRYSGQQDICVGTSVAGRPQRELEGMIGFFANTLALRSEVRPEMTFIDLLGSVKGMTLDAYGHQEVPFEKVVDAVVRDRQSGISPLFQVMLVLNNTPEIPRLQLGDLELSVPEQAYNTSKFDLTFFIQESPAGFQIAAQYNTGLFSEARIRRMTDHFKELLLSVVSSPESRIGELRILSAQEQAELLVFGKSSSMYPSESTIVDLFEAQAFRYPDQPAVVFSGKSLSYQELNEGANRVAAELRRQGVKAGTLVPIYTVRGLEMITGILGILKSGGAYVPIDTEFPMERISYMLEDTGALVAVSSGGECAQLRSASSGWLEVIDLYDLEQPSGEDLLNPGRASDADQLAYVIYTSGSTGKPKGVQVSHRNVVDYVYGLEERTGISSCRSFALVSTLATDLGNTVVYSSLIFGGALHVFTRDAVSHIETLHLYFDIHSIDCLKIVPSHWKALSPEDTGPLVPRRLLIFGGESLPSEAVSRIRAYAPECRIVNHYGPTETTIGKLVYELEEQDYGNKVIPIGKPFSNTVIYILDQQQQLSPVGVPGELYIGGTGVARGYLNRAELTKERFISDPFRSDGSRLYRTGDKVEYLQDGRVVFRGRVDDQVKIRGYRVEPGEVGRILEQNDQIAQAVVISREDKQGNMQLVGYVVPRASYDGAEVQAYLKEQLPSYMIPAYIISVDRIPLTANGKIDRKSLPDPEGKVTEEGYTEPDTMAERLLAEIWQDVLEVERVGLNDNFFELGGHSLLAVRLISAIRKGFGADLPISDVFDYPTIALLAGRLEDEPKGRMLPSVIRREVRPGRVPLSFSQERLWFIDRLEGSVQYHIPAVLRLSGSLDVSALESTLRMIVMRHEILRTVIREEEGEGYQEVLPIDGWRLGKVTGAYDGSDAAVLQELTGELISRPFVLSEDYMLRADLIGVSPQEHILVVTMHHIASDGWSTSILVKEVVSLYAGYVKGETADLPSLDLQYSDYAIWQRETMQGELLSSKLEYWKGKLSGVSPLQLPTDYARGSNSQVQGATLMFSIEAVLADRVKALAQQEGVTLYMLLLSVFKVLLQRYSGQQDICVGSPVAGRDQQELEGMIGFFVNTLALRSEVRPEMTFIDLLGSVKGMTLDAYGHQEVPFEKVVDAVVRDRQSGISPLFQVMLVLNNTPEIPRLQLGDLELSVPEQEYNTSKFDLTFSIQESPAGFQIAAQYNTGLFSEARIRRMTDHFKELLLSVVSSPESRIGELRILSAQEQAELLVFGKSSSMYPSESTIVDLFEAQAFRYPDQPAVVFSGKSLSYQELNEGANRVAAELRRQGVKAGTLVPIYTVRGLEMITGILGILKSGGAYVPIDTEFPMERISYMLEDTGALVAVSSGGECAQLRSASSGWLEVIDLYDLEQPSGEDLLNPGRASDADQLAYVIYTSGSTGKPKGVQVSHRNVVDYVYGLEERTGISSCRSFALVSTLATDLGNTVVYSSLIFGGALHVFTRDAVSHIETLHLYFDIHSIDCLKIVPSHWKALSPEDTGPLVPRRLLIFGGESLPSEAVSRIRAYAPECRIVNHYGPTETTIGKLVYELEEQDYGNKVIPIGKPFSNTVIYILDQQQQLSPVGVPGELYIGGTGVARGYLNRAELTKERFISDPFRSDGSRLYRTGDKVEYLQDGRVVFRGRVDDQVKIRGYRVEPGEVGRILEQNDQIAQAVVISREDKQGNMQLVGYVVPGASYDGAEVQAYLKEQLPSYMIPAYIISVDRIPLTANGKIDRKSLPDPELGSGDQAYVAPDSATEIALAGIWQELLQVERVGLNDNFFELGGHSLLAMRVVSSIRRSLQVEVSVRDIFNYPGLSVLGEYLDGQVKGRMLPSITRREVRPLRVPLSFSQERLWFIDRLEGSVQYHIPAVLRLSGSLDVSALESTLRMIVMRHEVLRTVIREEEGEGYQEVLPIDGWRLGKVTGAYDGSDAAVLQELTGELISRPFVLSEDYMLRADLIGVSPQEHILVVTMHHIASDGWSTSILVKEVVSLYAGYVKGETADLPSLDLQYSDYAIWQRETMQGELLSSKLEYWKGKLSGVSPLQLPTDYARPAVQSLRGSTQSFHVEGSLTGRLSGFAQQEGVTLYMLLLSVFKVLLQRYSGQQDICVGSPVAGRDQQELEGMIGFFVNTLALRSEVRPEMTFIDLLRSVKGMTLDAYGHQEVPFEKVVDAVVRDRDGSRSPLFQVMFVLQNTPEIPRLQLGDLELSVPEHEYTDAKFDLTFSVKEGVDGLDGVVEYATDLYSGETISRMIGHYVELLGSVLSDAGMEVGRMGMLGSAEQQELLSGFNRTEVPYEKEKSVLDLFREQAYSRPDSAAVIYEGEELSYGELNRRSNQLAHYLVRQGVKSETLVPIVIERGLEMIIGILGILKSGGAYVPVDPEYPVDRISYMLEDTGGSLVLSSKESRGKLSGRYSGSVVSLDEDWQEIAREPSGEVPDRVSPDQLAYVIYTSGSTGQPKGVMIQHNSLMNLLTSFASQLDFTSDAKFLSVTTYSFDICYLELYLPLITGAKLLLVSKQTASDGFLLMRSLSDGLPTHMQGTPSTWQLLLDSGWANKEGVKMLVGGEALREDIKESLTGIGQVWNVYGPTETTIWSTIKELKVADQITIGKPIWNTRIYVLSESGEVQPVGVPGEIYIGGAGLARGYLNRAELTAERFIPDPFRSDGSRLYRTGDLGRWLADGNIVYLGRIDDQVKIRGYRIELGEIESVLMQSGLVSQGVVLARSDVGGNKRLVGYVVCDGDFDRAGVQGYLSGKLPEYMVPQVWVSVDRIPLTANGKIDRKSLPDPELGSGDQAYVAPDSATEIALAGIWQELLQVERVGLNDNFFELGGHSLLAMRMVWIIRKTFNEEIPLHHVFLYPTISGLINQLSAKDQAPSKLLLPIKSTGSKNPLYIICGIGGTIFKFVNFVNMLDSDQPVYGLQQPADIESVNEFPTTTEGIAEVYVKEILKQNPQGPYALSGHCFGGKIAFEMAIQLKKMNKEVSMLSVFDAYAREEDTDGEIADIQSTKLDNLKGVIKKIIQITILKVEFESYLLLRYPKQAVRYKINKINSFIGRQRENTGDPEMQAFEKVSNILRIAARNYKMKYYSGEILAFYAKEKYYFTDIDHGIFFKKIDISDDVKYAWKTYASSVKIDTIEGEHSTIFGTKNVGGLASVIQEGLNKTNQRKR